MIAFRRPAVVRLRRPATRAIRALLAGAVLAVVSVPAVAQPSIQVQVGEGLVSVRANGASVSEILAEWARVGGVTLVNGETVPEGPVVTFRMDAVPEGKLLDALLGGVAGYLATLRPARSRTGTSVYDRVLILDTSTVAVGPPARELESIAPAPAATDATEEREFITGPSDEASPAREDRHVEPARPSEGASGEGVGDQPRRELARPHPHDETGGAAQGRPEPAAPPRTDRQATKPMSPPR